MHRKPSLSFRKVSAKDPVSLIAAGLVLAGLSILNSGCGYSDPVTVYEAVPVTRTLDPAMAAGPREPKFRMIAAINDQTDATWFLKMTGSIAQVAAAEIKWQEFLASISFENGDPKWNLPESWRTGEEREMRFATLYSAAGDDAAEISISSLPPGQPLAMNVNRWRGQLGLPPSSEAEIMATLRTVAGDGTTFNIYDARGPVLNTGMGGAPFASGMVPGMPVPGEVANDVHGGIPAAETDSEPAPPDSLTFDPPADWVVGKATSFVASRWSKESDDGPIEMTLMRMNTTDESWQMNLRAWSSQVGMTVEPVTDEVTVAIKVGGADARLARLDGAGTDEEGKPFERSVVVAMFSDLQDNGWVLKLSGSKANVDLNRESFDKFLQSVKFAPKK